MKIAILGYGTVGKGTFSGAQTAPLLREGKREPHGGETFEPQE